MLDHSTFEGTHFLAEGLSKRNRANCPVSPKIVGKRSKFTAKPPGSPSFSGAKQFVVRLSALQENFICLRLQRSQGCEKIDRWFRNVTIDDWNKGPDWHKG